MDLDLLRTTLEELEQPRFRFDQIWKWTADGVSGYHEMTNLPAALREQLSERVPFSTLHQVRSAKASDGTEKLLLTTHDGRPIETVLMRYKDGRRSICVSSQSGCPLTCTFCATGQMKFGRNLTAWEILDQALALRRLDALNHCVFMGMGEPMMNLPNVLEVCRRLPDLGITNRRTGISTVGWVPGIDQLTESDVPVRLAWSLHAPEDQLRSEIMPVNDRYALADVKAACDRFYERRRKMIFVEYVMLAGVNDSVAQARQLADLLEPWKYKINLIPYNPTDSIYDGSARGSMDAFRDALEDRGYNATIRLIRGRDIDAACGQLAAKAAAA
ncbi:23S rRNA (adenine(2503)-C(2))-methyltransferase RlmN [Patulibacter medicamentivorans]|uniref:23S rRNA (adenine(2503)-C(2))-methyltransferase RlmN n=1 Tax=Patulibacter medicamentivorans TaxID=1097667 RepID=UPI00147899E2|nr:23S rRNA (adenine(2503)-C(2))-methyltransferase RlmN [Patulibacter medicamentivorans]